ncbi:MAG: hypothetical protein WHT06_04920 [Desulfobacterales bacterium]
MQEAEIKETVSGITSRRTEAAGGFAQTDRGGPRPDATAWAVLALKAAGEPQSTLAQACRFLSRFQLADGRVVFSGESKAAWWPTPLAALAWGAVPGFEGEKGLALGFLLKTGGRRFQKKEDSPTGHDTAIRGWSWIEETHSRVEPTALSVLALRAGGKGGRPRVAEAAAMLMNRRLPGGGWNYGNTTVFGQELLPMPDSTGLALAALSGMAGRAAVEKSLGYAQARLRETDAPFSLFWLACGLAAWGIDPPDLTGRILDCLALPKRRGPYETTLLSMLLLAYACRGKVVSFLGVG